MNALGSSRIAYVQPTSLWRRRRSVRVSVLVAGHEQDGFEAATAKTLVPALRRTFAHLPARDASVRLIGAEELSLPLGLRRVTRSQELPDVWAALAFLGS